MFGPFPPFRPFRPLRRFASIALLGVVSPLFGQEKPPAGPPPDAPAQGDEKKPDAPAVIEDNTGVAIKFAADQANALASKDAAERAGALATFAIHRSEVYVKVAVPLLKDKDPAVVKAALVALGNQPFKSSTDALLVFVCDEKKGAANDEQRNEGIKQLGNVGLGKHGFEKLHDVFPKLDDDGKNAAFETFIKAREKHSFSLMVDFMDQPTFSGANRPSTADQKKAFDTWKACKANVRRGLRELTGEGFPTAKQYIEWADTPAARKLGFSYQHGK